MGSTVVVRIECVDLGTLLGRSTEKLLFIDVTGVIISNADDSEL